jgi:hypothetical protein
MVACFILYARQVLLIQAAMTGRAEGGEVL